MDREKVIDHLNECMELSVQTSTWVFVQKDIVKDALELLKEQKSVKPVRDEETGWIWLCGKCGYYVGFDDNDPHHKKDFDKYCRDCGTPVLWKGR